MKRLTQDQNHPFVADARGCAFCAGTLLTSPSWPAVETSVRNSTGNDGGDARAHVKMATRRVDWPGFAAQNTSHAVALCTHHVSQAAVKLSEIWLTRGEFSYTLTTSRPIVSCPFGAAAMRSFFWSLLFALVTLVSFGTNHAAESTATDWPRWRGADGSGVTTDTKLPVEWNTSNIVWKTELPGIGQSSPIVFGDRIFLTSYENKGEERLVFCVNRKTGKLEWKQTAWKGTPEKSHNMNGWASSSCATDGERVYASFGLAGMHCYTIDGKHVWSKELGKFETKNARGTAASPILYENLVIWNGDSESDPFLFGLNKLTGEIVWKGERSGQEGYSTPVLFDVNGRKELVLNGDPTINGYDPATGKTLWKCKCFAGRGEPTPAIGKDAVYVVNGLPGDIFAVRPGGIGDVTKTHIAWHTPRKEGRDEPSPALAAGKWMVVCSMAGIVSCYDVENGGQEVWGKKRLGFGNITASPFVAGDKVYFQAENGEFAVLQAGPEFKVLAMNKLDPEQLEIFRASPTPCDGQIFIRSDRKLYCIGKGKS